MCRVCEWGHMCGCGWVGVGTRCVVESSASDITVGAGLSLSTRASVDLSTHVKHYSDNIKHNTDCKYSSSIGWSL